MTLFIDIYKLFPNSKYFEMRIGDVAGSKTYEKLSKKKALKIISKYIDDEDKKKHLI